MTASLSVTSFAAGLTLPIPPTVAGSTRRDSTGVFSELNNVGGGRKTGTAEDPCDPTVWSNTAGKLQRRKAGSGGGLNTMHKVYIGAYFKSTVHGSTVVQVS